MGITFVFLAGNGIIRQAADVPYKIDFFSPPLIQFWSHLEIYATEFFIPIYMLDFIEDLNFR